MRLLIVTVVIAACGGAQQPSSSGMRELAVEIDTESAHLARIIHDLRGDCPRMATELEALFSRMRRTFERAGQARRDPALAKELTSHLRAYDGVGARRNAAIDADLAENPACMKDAAVRDVMMTMPTL